MSERHKVSARDLGSWRCGYHREWGWCVEDAKGKLLVTSLTKSQAMMIAAVPALARMLASIARSQNHPLWVDLDAILGRFDIELVE